MIFGFSDAKLCVTKRGPEEVREQGLLCDHIGEKVCPRVYRFLEDGYEMELLEPAPARTEAQLISVMVRLTEEVWPRRSYRNWNHGWLDPLIQWSMKAPWLTGPIRINYPEEPVDGYCLIHGDPALSNLMSRSGYLVLTDPMPRMEYRKEIPNRREVDLGKLVQSAMGWERVLGCNVMDSMWDQWYTVTHKLDSSELARLSLLWGAIHLARVHLRARAKGRSKIALWAEDASRKLAAMSC